MSTTESMLYTIDHLKKLQPLGWSFSGVTGEAWLEHTACQKVNGETFTLIVTFQWDEETGKGQADFTLYLDENCEIGLDHYIDESVNFDNIAETLNKYLAFQRETLENKEYYISQLRLEEPN